MNIRPLPRFKIASFKELSSQDNVVTKEHLQDALDVHNEFRSQVALGNLEDQPPAQNMLKMSWDKNLARRAHYWASLCQFKHDKERGSGVGQNIYMKYFGGPHFSRKVNFTEAVAGWFSEHKDYTYKTLQVGDSSNPKTQTGHYTQVIWSNTILVGCGFANYFNLKKQRDENLIVCNYSPAGNFINQYPYVKGKPNCKANGLSNSDIDGLCEKDRR